MLAQSNAKLRTADLIENRIYVKGEEDGIFDSDDYILFFGQGPDTFEFDLENQLVIYENNDYDDFSYYFLTISGTDGIRVVDLPNPGTDFPEIDSYFSYRVHEVDKDNLVKSGREWFERLSTSDRTDIGFTFPGFMPNENISITSRVMARTFSAADYSISNNNQIIYYVITR